MKSYLFIVGTFFSVILYAQEPIKKNGSVALKTELNMEDLRFNDYEVEILNRSQQPIPSAEYGNKKQELLLKRLAFNKKIESNNKKTRATAINPTITKGWLANSSSSTPLDNDIAVSNDGKVVSVVNSNMRVYDDTGKQLGTVTLTAMVAALGSYTWISDPRILYDVEKDRFVLVCFTGDLSFESKIFVGFSKTNDPLGAWNFYALNGNSFNDSTWSDYPIISLSKSDLFMTFNQVKDSVSWTVGFKQSVIWQIDKQKGYNGDSLQYTLWSNLQLNGKNFRNICPAKQQSLPYDDANNHFLSLRNVDTSNDSIFLFNINNSQQSGLATLSKQTLKSNKNYGFPPNAIQKKIGTSQQYLMTNDARILAAIYENDRIYFGSNTLNPTYMNAALYLGCIKYVSSTPSITANIISSDSIEYGYPSMAYMGANKNDHKILYSFSHCVTQGFAGNSVMYHDALDNMSDIIRVKNGTHILNMLSDSTERWGDYSGIQKKYNTTNTAYLANSCMVNGTNRAFVAIVNNLDNSIANVNTNYGEVFPNPATNKISIEFENDKYQKLQFAIFDLQGKKIAQLINDNVKKGNNIFTFNTNPLSAGIYFITIINENKTVATKKFNVIK